MARVILKNLNAVEDPTSTWGQASKHNADQRLITVLEKERADLRISESHQCERTRGTINYVQKVGTNKEGHVRRNRALHISAVKCPEAEQSPTLKSIQSDQA